jgi:pyrimidine deaminase RibD-like protein/riboflavin biosynthesis pyrimidine reductase
LKSIALSSYPEANFGFFIVMREEQIMQKVLKLAEKGRGYTSPNPKVGAVLVRNGRIVGQGYHRKAGKPHAEVEAIRDAGKGAAGSTLYVNLEPCCHFGKTPPCTDEIIASGIEKVVYSTRDPNPAVNGKGARILKKHGVKVKSGLLAPEAKKLNEAYFKFRKTGLPFVTLKIEQTLDGKRISAPSFSESLLSDSDRKETLRNLSADKIITGMRISQFIGRAGLVKYLRNLAAEGILSVIVNGADGLGAKLLRHGLIDKICYLISPEFGLKKSALELDLGINKISESWKLREVKYQKLSKVILVSGYLTYN